MPPWVRHQFPEAGQLVRCLRDEACADPGCSWCQDRHNASRELKRFFGFDDFRPKPADNDGRSLQQLIVESAMQGRDVLAILPTGTGKSLCYQIPALSRYDKTGALTVVISPLVALMADQVAGLQRLGITSCVTINGLLSMPERAEALERVRLGDAAIVLISPEQLRSMPMRRALRQREIGAWVLDEAHCLSKWGPRLPSRLSLRGALHPRAGRQVTRTAGAVSDRDGQAGRDRGDRRLLPEAARRRDGSVRRRQQAHESGVRRGRDHRLQEAPRHPRVVDLAYAAGDRRRGDRVLRDAAADRGGRRLSRHARHRRRSLPRRIAAGREEKHPAELYRRRFAGDRCDERVRDGHRQARCAAGDSRRHPVVAGELPAGGWPRRQGPAAGTLRAALRPRRCGTAVQHVGILPAHTARDSRRVAGAAQP